MQQPGAPATSRQPVLGGGARHRLRRSAPQSSSGSLLLGSTSHCTRNELSLMDLRAPTVQQANDWAPPAPRLLGARVHALLGGASLHRQLFIPEEPDGRRQRAWSVST